MKKYLILVFCLGLLSCNMKNSVPTEENVENLTVSTSGAVEFLLATAIPVEGGYSFSQQAEHFEVSEIRHKEEGIFYFYKPNDGFTGNDVVKIKRADSNGAEIISETITTINIKVVE